MNGYILESKSILNSDIWRKPPMYFKVWHYLLLRAQFQDYNGLKRGQLFTSIPEIQDACTYMVGYRKERPSRKEIFGIIEWLRNPHEGNNEGNNKGPMIVTTKVTHGMIVTICNYSVYQDFATYEGNSEGIDEIPTKEQRKEQKGANNKNKDKNEYKNKENIDIYCRVLEYLNNKIGTKYKATAKATKEHINARLKEGFTEEDFIKVIDKKYREWKGTEFEQYLRPATLFGTKFESYLNAPERKNNANKTSKDGSGPNNAEEVPEGWYSMFPEWNGE